MSKKNKKTKEEVTNKFKVPDNHVHVNAFLHKDDLTIVLKTLMGKIYDRSTEDRAKLTKKIWSNIEKRDAEKRSGALRGCRSHNARKKKTEKRRGRCVWCARVNFVGKFRNVVTQIHTIEISCKELWLNNFAGTLKFSIGMFAI